MPKAWEKIITPQQRRFVEEYVKEGMTNATAAAVAAGYKSTNAAVQASRMLTKQHVRSYMNELTRRRSASVGVTTNYVLKHLMSIAEDSRNDGARVAALDRLGKYLNMFVERTEMTASFTNESSDREELGELSDDQLRRMLSIAEEAKSQPN